jgi:2,4-dienoyl-CoA reductase-like NADH-dependent reductase (Old Yellow Enzyme family)
MKDIYKPLFTPWKIGNVEIKNRIVMTSMGGTSIFGWMEPNHFDKEAADFLLERAKKQRRTYLARHSSHSRYSFGKMALSGQR